MENTNGTGVQPTPTPAKASNRVLRKFKLTSIKDLTPSVRELIFKCEEPLEFQFRAGQFVMLHVPDEPKPALRAYSIASTDQDKSGFTLLLKYVEKGKASEYVWNLKGGESLTFTGPFGKVFFKEPAPDQVVFLNTGSGVSQHLCFLESLGAKYPAVKFKMLFGVRYENEIYYQKELESLRQRLPNFDFQYVVSRPSESWQGLKGYVQNHLQGFDYLKTPTHFYLCGNGSMIKDVKAKLAEEGFDASHIIAEAFN